MLVGERFNLDSTFKSVLSQKEPKFGFDGFGEIVMYRTYSRYLNGRQENWADIVVRVTEGIFSIRKDYYIKNRLKWEDREIKKYAEEFALSMFEMNFLPPGRGLWACGTDFVYTRGSAALNNCGACTTKDLVLGATYCFDMLMNGCGLGADVAWTGEGIVRPDKTKNRKFIIEDSREGWVDSLRYLMRSYLPERKEEGKEEGKEELFPIFDYSSIRPAGTPLKGFGGKASGPLPLMKLHARVEIFFDTYLNFKSNGDEKERAVVYGIMVRRLRSIDYSEMDDFETFVEKVKQSYLDNPLKKQYDKTRLVVDIINSIGVCVVAGNVRRSSELIMGSPHDLTFANLKNYKINPEREVIGWMSNNSVRLEKTEDFSILPFLCERIADNGEPGVFNQLNVNRYGRIGHAKPEDILHLSDYWNREIETDSASLCNPCGEIPLEPFELCNLAEVFPTRCLANTKRDRVRDGVRVDELIFTRALEFATFYASTVALLPTHWEITNSIIARNRRIGVSMSGIADLYDLVGATELTRICRFAYKKIREVNGRLAREAGVPASIRVTTVKPSGTLSILAGVSPGIHFPTFNYAIRRVRISKDSPLVPLLKETGYHWEPDFYGTEDTLVFEFPIDQGNTRDASKVSLWEQFSLLTTLQREYSDNMVSVTLYFDPKTERNQLEHALAHHAPLIKSCSILPQTPTGSYKQMPYEGISPEEYLIKKGKIRVIDWSRFNGSDGQMPKYCNNDTCLL